uniref:Radical SAM core domain-containing protein n=1 Tax=Odontella aurita TaxID=265563 RepID=A0A7S4NG30_9STRA|mmetsp:Transcript_61948/g.182999  ORF Transcript_61948/g.182999 Transcript_61948/m.182999 type:complete len:471 (+) Transcript_61948:27-1439(+)
MPPHPPPPIIHLALQRCSSLSSLRTAATKEAARGRRCLAASESSDRVARALSSFPASAADDTTGSSRSLHLAAHVLPSRHPSLFERSLLPCRRGDIQPDGASGISTSAISAQQRRWAHSRSAVRMPLRKAAKSTSPASRRRRPPSARPPSRRQRSLALRRSSTNLVHFRSLGCPRNWVDTEHMLGLVLEQSGFSATDDPTAADYTVINTCGFLKAARDESRGEIEDVLANKKEGSKLIVTGCMINIRREEIMREYPEIDAVLGSGAVDKILEAIDECDRKDGDDDGGEEGGEPSETEGAACLEKEEEGDSSSERGPRGRPLPEPRSYLANGDVPRRVATPSHYAYLKIAEGCMKRCSFCVIPKIKGPLKSKPVEQVVDEFKVLLDGGAREIVLIAQDLGDYGKDLRLPRGSGGGGDAGKPLVRGGEVKLARLLRAMLDLADDPNVWIRLMYLYTVPERNHRQAGCRPEIR